MDHLNSQQNTSSKNKPSLCRGEDKVFAGVCSGLANHWQVDAIVVRVTCVVLFVCTVGLITIAYIVLALTMRRSQSDECPLEVNPISVASDKYQEVVKVRKKKDAERSEQYGIHANSGHIPPKPPQDGETNLSSQTPYIAYQETPVRTPKNMLNRLLLALIIMIAAAVLFVVILGMIIGIGGYPDWDLEDCWPVLFVALGVTVLICAYDRLSLPVRISLLVLSLEVCIALLPLTLEIFPPYALARLDTIPMGITGIGVVFLILSVVQKRQVFLHCAVVLFALALACGAYEMDAIQRLMAAQSYSHHVATRPFFFLRID